MIRRSSGDLVAAHLRRMVFEGEYKPGDRVRQDEIAAELGVSRIPVREAIIALDREGWVTVEPHRGAFVRGIDADYVRDHYELYGLVFGLMASRVGGAVRRRPAGNGCWWRPRRSPPPTPGTRERSTT